MDERLILLILVFAYLLFNGVLGAFSERQWTNVKSNKFVVYIMTNIVLPVIILGIYREFGSLPGPGANFAGGVQADPLANLNFLIPLAVYVLTLVELLTSYYFWPFAKEQKIALKTLILVFIAVFVVEMIGIFTSPKSTPSGPIA